MADENIREPNPPTAETSPESRGPSTGLYVVSVNLGVLAIYTLILRFVDGAMLFDAILLIVHFLVCLVMSIVKKSGFWVLAALLVLIIGISTCVYVLPPFKI